MMVYTKRSAGKGATPGRVGTGYKFSSPDALAQRMGEIVKSGIGKKPRLLEDRFDVALQVVTTYNQLLNQRLATISNSTSSHRIREYEKGTPNASLLKEIRDEIDAIAKFLKRLTIELETGTSKLDLSGSENDILKSVVKAIDGSIRARVSAIDSLANQLNPSASPVRDDLQNAKATIKKQVSVITGFLDLADRAEQFSPIPMPGQPDRFCADFGQRALENL